MNLPNLPSFPSLSKIPFKAPSFSSEDLLNVSLNSATGQAIILVAIVFFILALFAMSRRILIRHSIKGMVTGIILGMVLLGIIEAGFVWGIKSINTGKNLSLVPIPVKNLFSQGQDNLNQVLGTSTERSIPTAQSVVADFEILPKLDSKLVVDSICKIENSSSSSTSSITSSGGEVK